MTGKESHAFPVLVLVVGLATVTGAVVPVVGTVTAPPSADSDANSIVAGAQDGVPAMATAAVTQDDSDLKVNRTTVAFGAVPVGESERAAVAVRNEGDRNLSIADVNIAGDDLRSFSVETASVPRSLAPGEREVVRVAFEPVTTGPAELSLELVTTTGESVRVTLSGTGVRESTNGTGGNLSVEPTRLFLGEATVGETATRNLTVANTGTGPLTISEFRVGGRNASMFGVGVDSLTLAPGEERTVTVRFTPTSEGPKAADLFVTPRDGEPVEVSLVAAASGPNLVVEPRPVEFGTVASGSSATRTVTIRNDGSGPITIEGVRLRGVDSSQFSAGDASGRLPAGDAREVRITFAPSATGRQTARLVVRTNNDALRRVVVQLRGAVRAPEVAVSSRSLQFGEATVGERIVREFTVTNTGEATLRIDGASISGPADVFSLQGSTPVTVAPGGERTLSVAFRPDRARSFSGTLRLSTNDPDEPTVPIWLTNTDTTVSMRLQQQNGTTRLNASVRSAEAGQRLSMNVTEPDADENVTVTGVSMALRQGGNFSIGITATERPQSTTPAFEPRRENGTIPLQYLDISHSISNENIAEATLRVSVRKSRIDAMNTTDPDDVQLYRYEPGMGWVGKTTTLLRETDTHYVYRAVGDGFSEWATGAKQAQFDVVRADVSVSTITVGDSVNINVRIENTGGADGDFLTELLLDGDVVDTREVEIAAGGTAQVTFDRAFARPGEYTVRVNDVRTGQVVVSSNDTSGSTAGGESGPTDGGTDGSSAFGPGFGIPATVVALLAAGLLARRRE